MNVVGVVLCAALGVAGQADDDLGGGAPLTGPTPAELGTDVVEEPAAPETPTPTPTPTPTKKKPAPAAAPPRAPAAPAAPTKTDDKSEEKANKLRADLEAGLLDLSDKKALQQKLDALASTSIPEGFFTAEPRLKPLQKLVRARAHLVAGRLDDADLALKDARAAFDFVQLSLEEPQARRLSAALRFFTASVLAARARADLFTIGCGQPLGLKKLASDEARRRRKLLEDVADRFLPVSQGPDRLWARRAAFEVTALYEDVARHGLVEPSYRSIPLPSPYSIDLASTSPLLDPLVTMWLGEIRRSYGELIAAIDVREPDPALVERMRERTAALATVAMPANEALKNPWAKDLHEGVVRLSKRTERRTSAGRFVPVETKVGIASMLAALPKGPGTIEHAYALVGLAEAAPDKVSAADVVAALAHGDDRVVVAGLIAAEQVVTGKGGQEKAGALREPVTTAFAAAPVGPAAETKKKAFTSLQASLFSRSERGLLALAAIAKADRAAAEAIVADERIPAVERAWMIAELADPRFATRFDNWAWDRDERVAALAVWGGVVARGRHASYLLRPAADGLVGCVSRAAAPP
ncbi:MAG: hypothetical protein Q8O67_28735 [Deltaproteobacteria bacterium]|nr:hypothetical protein [Deltaproteobacteria bacterium]